ncbi:MAG: hypothetical protein HKM98_11195 [Gammaproteobacteria bacterium]|nr:hypothetical protein [Gammaproteobacteria bacterium]
MIETVEVFARSLTVALVPVGLAVIAMHLRMLHALRTHHREVWLSLGSPRLWFAKTSSETLNTLRFLWRRDYRALGDNRVSTLCSAVRALHLAFVVLFIGAAALFFALALLESGVLN